MAAGVSLVKSQPGADTRRDAAGQTSDNSRYWKVVEGRKVVRQGEVDVWYQRALSRRGKDCQLEAARCLATPLTTPVSLRVNVP